MERLFSRTVCVGLLCIGAWLSPAVADAQCLSLSASGSFYNQFFDTLPTSGTSTALPYGWRFIESGTGGNGAVEANDGSASAGGIYSYGTGFNPDRALGALRGTNLIPAFGACFNNATGDSLTSLRILYRAEQWRLGGTGRTDRLNFQLSFDATSLATGTWIDVDELDVQTLSSGTPGPRDGNLLPNTVELSSTIAGLNILPGKTFWIRWKDLDVVGEEDGLAIDGFYLGGYGSGVTRNLTVANASTREFDSGVTPLHFTVSLSSPAGVGGVNFTATTSNGSALAGSDYTSTSISGSIPQGSTSTQVTVNVTGDTAFEDDEYFLLDLSNVTGANAVDSRADGLIINDDIQIFGIGSIQGAQFSGTGNYVGERVTTRGIVTVRTDTGFFMQTPDADVDASYQTSEGIFVFTGGTPPAAAAVGNYVQVYGLVQEFAPPGDPLQPTRTQIGGGPTVALLSGPHPLPARILLPTLDINGRHDQFERYEGMRVAVGKLLVTGPTQGTVNEVTSSAISNGVFHAVSAGTFRPYRQPGIEAPNPAPPGNSIPPLPRWDGNPELIAIDSDALGGTKLDLNPGSFVSGITGILDQGKRRYMILRDPGSPITIEPHTLVGPARPPVAGEFTVVSYNLGRFFDAIDNPAINEPVLTSQGFANRKNKASLGIRNFLRMPDILGVQEVESLSALQELADKINSDAVAAGGPNPAYVAYVMEGNNQDGLDVGFMVKTAKVDGIMPRVEVVSVVQAGKSATWTDPGLGRVVLLNDRPPLVLSAIIHDATQGAFPVTAIVVHQRSRDGIDSEQTSGLTTLGDRARQKRQRQAEFVANLVQGMQTADPNRSIVVLGDFNAFQFNDGYADVMSVVTGTQYFDNTTAVVGDGATLVSPSLLNLTGIPHAGYAYSLVSDGNMQSFDHILVNMPLGMAMSVSTDYAHINADVPEVRRGDANTPWRLSAHDPVIAYFAPVQHSDLAVTAAASKSTVSAGQTMTFSSTVANVGSDDAPYAGIGFAFNAILRDLKINAPPGWTCDAPGFANGTTSLSCFANVLGLSQSATFSLSATAPAEDAGAQIDLAVLATSAAIDPAPTNGESMVTVSIAP